VNPRGKLLDLEHLRHQKPKAFNRKGRKEKPAKCAKKISSHCSSDRRGFLCNLCAALGFSGVVLKNAFRSGLLFFASFATPLRPLRLKAFANDQRRTTND
jgi:hypothetical protein